MGEHIRKHHYSKDLKVGFCNARTRINLTKDWKKVTCKLCLKKRYGMEYKKRFTKAELENYELPIPTKEMIKRAEEVGKQMEKEYRGMW